MPLGIGVSLSHSFTPFFGDNGVRYVLFDGDSLTEASTFPEEAVDLNLPWTFDNIGAAGESIAQIVARGTATDAYFNTANSFNVLFMMGGVNNFEAVPFATAYSQLQSYWAARRAKGWTVVASTLLPAHWTGEEAGRDLAWASYRASLNALIVGDPTKYDYLADYAADPIMGPDAAALDTGLYSDGLHINNVTGAPHLAAIAGAIIEEISNNAVTAITVSPPTATVEVNDTEQFAAVLEDTYGNVRTLVTPTWSATVGSIDTNGLFTAPATVTTGSVSATVGAVSDSSAVTIEAAPGVFSPSDISGMVAWYKADSLALSDGDAVGSWADSSPNGNHVTQATAGKKPTFKTNILNGKPVVRFDGEDFLQIATLSPSVSQPTTIYCVAKDRTGINIRIVYDGIDSSHRQNMAFIGNTLSAYAGTQLTGGDGLGTSFLKTTILYNGASSSARLNGASWLSGDIGSQVLVGLTVGGLFNMATGFSLDGDIAELIIYNGLHDATQYGNVEAYFASAARWAV